MAVRHVVAQGRKAIRLAALFHVGELFEIEFLIFDRAPIIFCFVHRETWRERSFGANDQPVLARAAAPMFSDSAYESLHILQAWNGVEQFVALALLVNQPID